MADPVPPAAFNEAQLVVLNDLMALHVNQRNLGGTGFTQKAIAESERLSSHRSLRSSSLAPVPIPGITLAQLPADSAAFDKGSIPLVPTHNLPLTATLDRMQQGQGSRADRPGSMLYEAKILLTLRAILDQRMQWAVDYAAMLNEAIADKPALLALVTAPLASLTYLEEWELAIVRGRINCLEAFAKDGKEALMLMSDKLFGAPAAFLEPSAAAMEMQQTLFHAKAKALATSAAARSLTTPGGGAAAAAAATGGRGGRGAGGGRRGGRDGGGRGGRGGDNAGAGAAGAGRQ